MHGTKTRLPEIQKGRSKGRLKSISFELSQAGGKCEKVGQVPKEEVHSHGNDVDDKTTITLEDITECETSYGRRPTDRVQEFANGSLFCGKERRVTECFVKERSYPKRHSDTRTEKSEDKAELKSMLRERNEEISRLQEIIHKMTRDRESAVCANANSRLRVAELKNKLSSRSREVEHVTAVERLRSKQRVSTETERLRHERDEARVQLAHHEKLVWQLRKQVEQLTHLGRQRYKTIQELNKKMATKDKSLQEMRKRLELAQLITVSSDRRASVSESTTRSITWEDTGRLGTVNE